MTNAELVSFLTDTVPSHPDNHVSADWAITPEDVGMQLYEAPIAAFGDANDPMFDTLRKPGVVGPQLLKPDDWLPGAKSVVSLFYPFTDAVKASNMLLPDVTGNGWLYGRIEGQKFLCSVSERLVAYLREAGYRAVAPQLDARFRAYISAPAPEDPTMIYTSNWSERHAAFVCGLGTFGLSKNLITARGCAGRFASVITDAPFSITPRAYTEVYEYCSMCMACVRRCPSGAIRPEGKEKQICAAFVGNSAKRYAPRYGCGKCQVAVPCMNGIPKKT